MDFDLKNKFIAVTGAGNGIGRAVSILLADYKAIVIGIDKDINSLNKLKKKINKNLIIKKLDCTKSFEIKETLKNIKKIDGLVNCAGVVPQGNIIECSEEEWKATIDINLTSMFLITKFFMKKFISQKKGSIFKTNSWTCC